MVSREIRIRMFPSLLSPFPAKIPSAQPCSSHMEELCFHGHWKNHSEDGCSPRLQSVLPLLFSNIP